MSNKQKAHTQKSNLYSSETNNSRVTDLTTNDNESKVHSLDSQQISSHTQTSSSRNQETTSKDTTLDSLEERKKVLRKNDQCTRSWGTTSSSIPSNRIKGRIDQNSAENNESFKKDIAVDRFFSNGQQRSVQQQQERILAIIDELTFDDSEETDSQSEAAKTCTDTFSTGAKEAKASRSCSLIPISKWRRALESSNKSSTTKSATTGALRKSQSGILKTYSDGECQQIEFLRPIRTVSSITFGKASSKDTFYGIPTDHGIILKNIELPSSQRERCKVFFARNADLICARCENALCNCTCIEIIKQSPRQVAKDSNAETNSEEQITLENIEEVEYEFDELPEENIIYETIEESEGECFTEIETSNYRKKSYTKPDQKMQPKAQVAVSEQQAVIRGFLQKSQPKFAGKSKKIKQATEKLAICNKPPGKEEEDNTPQMKDEKSIFELKNSSIDTQKHFESKIVVKPNIYTMLRLAFERNLAPSVRIQIDNVFIDCQMMVLKCYSDFFVKCENAQFIVLPSKCIHAAAFRMFYAWCLSGKPMISVATIVDLMKTAMYLRVGVLVDICFQHLYDDLFSEDVAFFIYLQAHKAGLPFVAHLMLARIGRFFLPMVASQEFLQLSPKEMLELLNADLIGVHTEAEVLFSLVRWSSFDWEKRQRFIPRLARNVRFGLMPVWYLYMLQRKTGVTAVDRVLSSKGVREFIGDSVVFALEREEANRARDELFKKMQLSNRPTFRERLWIVDEQAQRNVSYTSLSYGDFLKYLKHLRSRDLSDFQKFTICSSPKPRVNNCCHVEKTRPVVRIRNATESEEFSQAQQQEKESEIQLSGKLSREVSGEKRESKFIQRIKREEMLKNRGSLRDRSVEMRAKKTNRKY